MANKQITFETFMLSTDGQLSFQREVAYTNDVNSVQLSFDIKDLDDLAAYTPNVLLYMRDGSFYQITDGIAKTGTTVSYTLKGNEGKHNGVVRVQLVLIDGDKDLASAKHEFRIEAGLDTVEAIEVMIQDWTTLIKEATTFLEDSKAEYEEQIAILRDKVDNAIVEPEVAAKYEALEEEYAQKLTDLTAQLAQTSVDAKIGRESSIGKPKTALDIPTYDGHPTTTHPDVVYIPEGWNGFTHWMAFTPYPGGGRENPSIVASNNGTDWVVPEGLTNPLLNNRDASDLGFTFWSDTDLVLLPDNRLAVYFRGHSGTKEGIYRMVSSDGVVWDEFTLVLEVESDGGDAILSPAIVLEDDNTFSMYAINNKKTDSNRMEKRTSSNGISWGSPIQCVIPEGVDAWHVDVVKANGEYHALIASTFAGANGRLYYSKSIDGVKYIGDDKPSIPLSGYDTDISGHYRSALVPIPGNPLSFKVYVASWGINLSPTSSQWRILYYDNVVFENNTFRSIKKVDDLVTNHERIYIPANDFETTLGTPTKGFTGLGYHYWNLKVNDRVSASFVLPKDWNTVRVYGLVSKISGEVGTVALQPEILLSLPGENIGSPYKISRTGTTYNRIMLGESDELVEGFIWGHALSATTSGDRYVNKNRLSSIRVNRFQGTSTFDGELAFYGIILEKLDDDARAINTPPS